VGITNEAGELIDTFEGLALKSSIWIVGLLVVFVPLAIRLYRKLT
jgi:hypothetical protein